jgi:hypothetical protein
VLPASPLEWLLVRAFLIVTTAVLFVISVGFALRRRRRQHHRRQLAIP